MNESTAQVRPASLREQYVGCRFGRLTILDVRKVAKGSTSYTARVASCICDCGNTKEAVIGSLLRGATRSCGCLNRESLSKRGTHRLRRHPLYGTWLGMKNRCNNKNSPNFKDYGERGIFVSARWYKFENFLGDMGEKPGPDWTIERIDNHGPYAWWNCRWATRAEQSRNTRANRVIEFGGESMVMVDWCRRFGIGQASLAELIDRHGEQAAMDRAWARSQGIKLKRMSPRKKAQSKTP